MSLSKVNKTPSSRAVTVADRLSLFINAILMLEQGNVLAKKLAGIAGIEVADFAFSGVHFGALETPLVNEINEIGRVVLVYDDVSRPDESQPYFTFISCIADITNSLVSWSRVLKVKDALTLLEILSWSSHSSAPSSSSSV